MTPLGKGPARQIICIVCKYSAAIRLCILDDTQCWLRSQDHDGDGGGRLPRMKAASTRCPRSRARRCALKMIAPSQVGVSLTPTFMSLFPIDAGSSASCAERAVATRLTVDGRSHSPINNRQSRIDAEMRLCAMPELLASSFYRHRAVGEWCRAPPHDRRVALDALSRSSHHRSVPSGFARRPRCRDATAAAI